MSEGSGDGEAALPEPGSTTENVLDDMWTSSLKDIESIDPSEFELLTHS